MPLRALDHTAAYEYQPLLADEIRLIQLLPASFDHDLQFKVIHRQLKVPKGKEPRRTDFDFLEETLPTGWTLHSSPEGKPIYECLERGTYKHPGDHDLSPTTFPYPQPENDFEALSYTWGDQSHQEIAYVVPGAEDEQAVKIVRVGRNLAVALRYLRFPDQVRTLWADAICIDQGNVEERACQIKRIKLIYGLASSVMVWLGESSDNSLVAMNLLSYLGRQVEISTKVWLFSAFEPEASEPSWWDRQVKLPYTSTDWQAIECFFLRPWFDRLWVLQEVLANPQTTIRCGTDSMEWYHLRRAIAALDEKIGVPSVLSYRLDNKFHIAYGCKTPLREVVYIARQHQCQDPRDKIYGILELFGHELQDKISPSYDKPAEALYREIFLMHSEITGRLDLLTQCFLRREHAGLSSWVPDWRSMPAELWGPENGYQASGASKAEFQELADGSLKVTGIIIDQIVSVSDGAEANAESLADFIRRLRPSDLHDGNYVTGEPLMQAWARTLALDVVVDRYPERSAPTYAEWEQTVLGVLQDRPDTTAMSELANAGHLIRDTLTDMRFFRSTRGYFGFGPMEMSTGDVICVMLGIPTPLVLRSASDGTHQVVGWSYVHGMMDSEALLGPLPSSWVVQQADIDMRQLPMYGTIDGDWRQAEDPRLGVIPSGWKRICRRRFTADDPVIVDHFKNKETGEVINYDPRMTAGALQARGAPIETIVLV